MSTVVLIQEFIPIAERVIQGEKIIISYPKNEKLVNLVVVMEEEYKELEELRQKEKKAILAKGKIALRKAQEQAAINGTAGMTMSEIDAVIDECRQETRGSQ